jgi:hypothetical protein
LSRKKGVGMAEITREAIKNEMTKTVEGICFYERLHRNRQDIGELISDMAALIAQHNLSVLEVKGFLDYMKIILDSSSYLQIQK